MSLVVYWYVLALYCRPTSLKVAVEQERVEAAGWGDIFAQVEERGVFGLWVIIFWRKSNCRRVVVEGYAGIAKESPDVHAGGMEGVGSMRLLTEFVWRNMNITGNRHPGPNLVSNFNDEHAVRVIARWLDPCGQVLFALNSARR